MALDGLPPGLRRGLGASRQQEQSHQRRRGEHRHHDARRVVAPLARLGRLPRAAVVLVHAHELEPVAQRAEGALDDPLDPRVFGAS